MLQECCGATIQEWMEVKQHQTTISSDPKAEQTAELDICNPWCWNIYQHLAQQSPSVGLNIPAPWTLICVRSYPRGNQTGLGNPPKMKVSS